MQEYNCRICGLQYNFPIWGDNEDIPSFSICNCCGVEFGYEDNNIESVRKFRSKWIINGANWFNPNKRPQGWDFFKQIKAIKEKWI